MQKGSNRGDAFRNFMLTSTALSVMVGLPLAATPANAQGATAVEKVVVTGSRIPKRDYSSNSPLYTVDSNQIAQTGEINLENVMNTLPQVVPGLANTTNNGADGTSTVDLRGLGPTRTLVLINGRRMVPATNAGVVDINAIPSEMVERVEVVTGGASAVYGSDALGGVVNFVLKKNFEGVAVSSQGGISEQADAREIYGGAMVGMSDDSGANLLAHISYFNREGLFQGDRDWSKYDFTGLPAYLTVDGVPVQGGSSRGTGRIVNNPGNSFPVALASGFIIDTPFGTSNPVCSPRFDVVDTPLGPRGFCNVLNDFGGDRFNFAPVNYLSIPAEKYTLSAVGSVPFELLGMKSEAFIEAFFVNSEVDTQLAPSPLAATSNVSISPTSVFLSAGAVAHLAARLTNGGARAVIERRMVEFGARQEDFTNEIFQFGGGVRGEIDDVWSYEFAFQYGRTQQTDKIRNDLNKLRLQYGYDNCPVGSPVGCVPQSPFLPHSQAFVDWVRLNEVTDHTSFERSGATLTFTGALGPADLAFGLEYREDSSDYTPDANKQADNIVGFNFANPVSGSFDVAEMFGEVSLPLIKDGFFKYLGLEAGARLSNYSSAGQVGTYKVGGEFEPGFGLRLRGMYQSATRAPSVFELFQTPAQNFPLVFDPCDARFGPIPLAVSNRCDGTTPIIGVLGVPITGVNPLTFNASNLQIESTQLGNSNLNPESSDTVTLGLVYRPDFWKRTAFTVDYYNVRISDYISRQFGGDQSAVNACYLNGVAAACALLRRGPDGTLVVGNAVANKGISLDNGSNLKTSGVDFAASTGFEPFGEGNGDLSLEVAGTWLDKWVFSNPFAGTGDAVDQYSFDFGLYPKWKGHLRATYKVSDWTFSYRYRYVEGAKNVGALQDPADDCSYYLDNIGAGPCGQVASIDYHDLFVAYDINDNTSVNLVVRNLLDEEPQQLFDVSFSAANGDLFYNDPIGRYFTFAVDMKF